MDAQEERTPKAAHSRFGGSTAARWLACPGSVGLIETLPPEPESKYAREGTIAHALASHCLRQGERRAHTYEGRRPWYSNAISGGEYQKLNISREMCDAVQTYLDVVYGILDDYPDAVLKVEVRMAFGFDGIEADEVGGTADVVIWVPSLNWLIVIDYKHGVGVQVSVDGNEQALFYGAGVAMSVPDWNPSRISIGVVQPRDWRNNYGDGEPVRWADVDPVDLFEFAARVETGVLRAKALVPIVQDPGNAAPPDAFAPGKHCGFCKAAAVCTYKERQVATALAADPRSVVPVEAVSARTLPLPADLPLDKIGKIMAAADDVREWLDKVEQFAFGLLQQGIAVPGQKLVEKQARAKWSGGTEEEIAGYLAVSYGIDMAELMPPSLVTITEAEKLLKAAVDPAAFKDAKEDLRLRYVLKESSGLTIAPSSDKRPAVDAVANAVTGVAELLTA